MLAQEGSSIFILPSAFAKLAKEEFLRQFERYVKYGSSKAAHQEVMTELSREWAELHSDDTCFCCLRRRPRFGLPCGHCFCENCVKIFGHQSMADPWTFDIDKCFLCSVKMVDIHIKLKPETASVRVLSIDGGGTRGRVPLEFIGVLQDRLQLPFPIQYNFDIVYGTSSGMSLFTSVICGTNSVGAIIASALCVNGWTVKDCIASFENLSRLAFRPRRPCGIPVLSKIYEFIASLLVDSRYPARNLETALRMVFGSSRSVIDYSKAVEMGTMLGMPVTTVRDASPCVITNYNAVGEREHGSGKLNKQKCGPWAYPSPDYHVLRSKGTTPRIALWEA